MSQIVRALIEHRLTPDEIINLPANLTRIGNEELNGQWLWTNPNADVNFLIKYWDKKPEDFMKSPWNEEDLASLEKDNMSLHFFHPNLVTFDSLLTWFFFSKKEVRINEFKKLTRSIAEVLKTVDMLICPEISDDLVNENKILTVEMFRRKAIAENQPFMEL